MIKFDSSQEKKLQFGLSFTGKFSGDIKCYFRIYFKTYNIGFEGKMIDGEKIVFKIPALSEYVKSIDQEKSKASVEIINDRDIFLAWQDEIEFKNIKNVGATLEKENKEEEIQKPEHIKAEIRSSDIDSDIDQTSKEYNKNEKDIEEKKIINVEKITEALNEGINQYSTEISKIKEKARTKPQELKERSKKDKESNDIDVSKINKALKEINASPHEISKIKSLAKKKSQELIDHKNKLKLAQSIAEAFKSSNS